MQGLEASVARSAAGARLLRLLQTVGHGRDEVAGAIVELLQERGAGPAWHAGPPVGATGLIRAVRRRPPVPD